MLSTFGRITVLAFALAACTSPALPRQTLDIELGVDPARSEVVLVEVEVGAEEDAFFAASLLPTVLTLATRNVDVVLTHRIDGEEHEGWPDGAALRENEPRIVTLRAVFTNTGAERVSADLEIAARVFTGDTPELFDDDASISLTRIDDG